MLARHLASTCAVPGMVEWWTKRDPYGTFVRTVAEVGQRYNYVTSRLYLRCFEFKGGSFFVDKKQIPIKLFVPHLWLRLKDRESGKN